MLVPLVALLVGCGDRYPAERPAPKNEAERAALRAEDARISGPGYLDLDGRVFHYGYVGFAGFRVLIERNRLKFQGVSGEFEGITKLQTPRFSKVRDDLYFMSWPVLGDMGDNVVVNVRDMRVFAHLGAGSDYRQLRGDITCFGTVDECDPPQGRLQSTLESVIRLTLRGASPGGTDGTATAEPTPAARALEGKELRFRFDEGASVGLRIENHTALVDEGDGPAPRGGVFTEPADEVYFVSWDGEHGGQHIVFDARTMEVHDHIAADGRRGAFVARAEYFGPARGPN